MKLKTLKQYRKMSKPRLIQILIKKLKKMSKVRLANFVYYTLKSELPTIRVSKTHRDNGIIGIEYKTIKALPKKKDKKKNKNKGKKQRTAKQKRADKKNGIRLKKWMKDNR